MTLIRSNLIFFVGYNFAEASTKIKRLVKIIMIYYLKLFEEINKISSIKFIGNNDIRTNRLRDVVASEESEF